MHTKFWLLFFIQGPLSLYYIVQRQRRSKCVTTITIRCIPYVIDTHFSLETIFTFIVYHTRLNVYIFSPIHPYLYLTRNTRTFIWPETPIHIGPETPIPLWDWKHPYLYLTRNTRTFIWPETSVPLWDWKHPYLYLTGNTLSLPHRKHPYLYLTRNIRAFIWPETPVPLSDQKKTHVPLSDRKTRRPWASTTFSCFTETDLSRIRRGIAPSGE